MTSEAQALARLFDAIKAIGEQHGKYGSVWINFDGVEWSVSVSDGYSDRVKIRNKDRGLALVAASENV